MAGTNGKRRGIRANSVGAGRPARLRLTKAQKARFLELVGDGYNRSQATALVKAPKGSFRSLCRHDPLFEGDYEAARRLGRDPIAERLRGRLVDMALDVNAANSRALHNALMLYDDEYRSVFTQHRFGIVAQDGQGIEIKLAFDPAVTGDG